MAEFETTTAEGSGVPAGTTPMFYRSAANRIAAPAALTLVSGAADARTFTEAPGDAVNGIDVDVTRLPADPLGANADATVAAGAAGSISAKLRRISEDIATMMASLAALDNAVAGNEVQVDIVSGGLSITRPSTATISTPATSTADGLIVAGNVNRLGLTIRNRSTAALHLRYGGAAATEAGANITIDPGTTWVATDGYTGVIRGILEAGASASTAVVAELTA